MEKYIPGQSNHSELDVFYSWWHRATPHECWPMETSGTTGPPKIIYHSRQILEDVAQRTAKKLNYKTGDCTFLVLDISRTGGLMAFIRALENEQPIFICKSGIRGFLNEWKKITDRHHVSLTPPYLDAWLKENEELPQTSASILIGGAPVTPRLASKLINRTFILESYGMTETASMVAARQISPVMESHFMAIPPVKIFEGIDQTVVIQWEGGICHTQDLGKFYPNETFTIIGRKQRILNKGGLKIQIETIENMVRDFIQNDQVWIMGWPDSFWIEVPAIISTEKPPDKTLLNLLRDKITQKHNKHYVPLKWIQIEIQEKKILSGKPPIQVNKLIHKALESGNIQVTELFN